MLDKLKKHAFMIGFGIVFCVYLAFLALVFFAPRVDLYERGFVGCTKKMIVEFSVCQKNKMWCTLKMMLKNHVCDFKVVKTGFSSWLQGEQKTPWANYYFEPVTENLNPTEDEELQTYYQEHLDMLSEMEELNKKYFELEEKLNQKKPEVPQVPTKQQGETDEKAK